MTRPVDIIRRPSRVRAAVALLFAVAFHSSRSHAAPPQRGDADEVTLRIIVVGSEDEAARVVDRLGRGESFEALARVVSVDSTADRGGLIGTVRVSALRPELRDAIDHLAIGDVSPVVRVPAGFAVVKLDGASDAAPGANVGMAPNAGVSAAGAVKFVVDVDGQGESMLAAQHFEKPNGWELDPARICQVRTQSLAALQAALEDVLASDKRAELVDTPQKLWELEFGLGQTYAYEGRMDRSVPHFDAAYRIGLAASLPSLPLTEEALGIAYLHAAEMENDLFAHPGDRCLLSSHGMSAFARTGNVEKAVAQFTKYLARKPGELEVQWLLNLGYMALGKYPDGVPPADLIPLGAFASPEKVGRFVDIAPALGLDVVTPAGGVLVDDLDNDGRFDVVASTYDSCGQLRWFRNTPAGTFVDRTAAAGITGQVGGLNILQTDYNNDGCLDILQLRGAWEFRERMSLLKNNCDGTFADVTVESGLAQTPTRTQAAVAFDFNNDGRLDLFVASEDGPAQLLENKGDGTFENVARAAGVDRTTFTKGVAVGDYDNDGWPDLYLSNYGGGNILYHNNKDGTFADVTAAAGVPGAGSGFATWFFDYDNDGWPDLFVTSYYASVDETLRTYLKLPHRGNTMKLYRNLGDGTFRDVSADAGLDKVFMPMGANFGDIDNDGFPDIYLGTGNPSYGSLVPSVLLRNDDGHAFTDVTMASGTGELHKGHGVAFGDLDGDGYEDIVFEVGGATLGDAHALRVFKNPGNGNDWLNVKLIGDRTNRAAIGARLAVLVEDAGQKPRTIYRTVGSGGSFGASPLQQHIGLGRAARIARVEIWWPTSQTRQRFVNVRKNQTIAIREFGASYTTRAPSPPRSAAGQETSHGR